MLPTCDWSEPGANRYTGETIEAIHRMPLSKEALREVIIKVKRRDYDDLVEITKDSISGVRGEYDSEISFMNFGTGQVCRKVRRNDWKPFQVQHGMVYCSGMTCVLIPSICGNVSLITRISQTNSKLPRLSSPIDVPEEELKKALKSPFSVDNDVVPTLRKGRKHVIHSVDEPETIWLFLCSLILLIFFINRSKRKDK